MMFDTTPVEQIDGGCLLQLHISPRASRTQITGFYAGRLKIQVAAPPVESAANEALIAYLASRLGLSKSQLYLRSGHRGKQKVIAVEGLSRKELLDRLDLG